MKRWGWASLVVATLCLAMPATAERIDPRRDFLAAFLMFGADYRNKGPNNSLTGHQWIVVSTSPLTFHRDDEDTTITITVVDDCRYKIYQNTKKPMFNRPPQSKLIEVDFNALSNVELEDSSLGVWWLRGTGPRFWCEMVDSNGIKSSSCLQGPPSKPDRLIVKLGGGADFKAIASVYHYFFTRTCPRGMVD
jgi:hypothetical protein